MHPLPYFRPDSTFREAAGLEHARDILASEHGLQLVGFLEHDGAHNMAPIVARRDDCLHLVMVQVFARGQTTPPALPAIRHARRILTAVLNESAAGPWAPAAFSADVLAVEIDDTPDGRAVAASYAAGLIARS